MTALLIVISLLVLIVVLFMQQPMFGESVELKNENQQFSKWRIGIN